MGLFNFFKKERAGAAANEREQGTEEEIQNLAAALVSQFEKAFTLDFSIASLHTLDSILEQTAGHYKNQMDEATRKRTIAKAGAYIFEVARRNFGGKYYWYHQLNQPVLVTGQPDFEMSLLAYEKVKGRLENGYEDNIPFFFEGYVEGVEKKSSAMIV